MADVLWDLFDRSNEPLLAYLTKSDKEFFVQAFWLKSCYFLKSTGVSW